MNDFLVYISLESEVEIDEIYKYIFNTEYLKEYQANWIFNSKNFGFSYYLHFGAILDANNLRSLKLLLNDLLSNFEETEIYTTIIDLSTNNIMNKINTNVS